MMQGDPVLVERREMMRRHAVAEVSYPALWNGMDVVLYAQGLVTGTGDLSIILGCADRRIAESPAVTPTEGFSLLGLGVFASELDLAIQVLVEVGHYAITVPDS